MASDVEICNLALSHLGDKANVASINPPEGSAQAEYCSRFYPIARDALLSTPDTSWAFATRRIVPALLQSGWPEWEYAYAIPSDCLRVLAVVPSEPSDDYLVGGIATQQPFSVESLDDGSIVIYTDQENATVRYVSRVTDTTKFSAPFVTALSWELAAMLAGPLLKGDVGAAEAARCKQMAQIELSKAVKTDSNQRRVLLDYKSPFIRGR